MNLRDLLTERLGPDTEVGCARPLHLLPAPRAPAGEGALSASPCLRVAGHYHHSLIEGPGRRSCLLVSGCTLACAGCWALHLHSTSSRQRVLVKWAAYARMPHLS
jgi:hypothetical protein